MRSTHQAGIARRVEQYLKSISDAYVKSEIRDVLPTVCDCTKIYLLTFAPALISYVSWVLKEAVQSKKTRLYFLSRDGYQMYLIAKKIIEKKNYSIECKYLNVSRFSMRVPGYHLTLDKCIDEICVGGVDITLEKILRRSGISDSERDEVINNLGYKEAKDEILNYHQILNLRNELNSSLLLKRYIHTNSINKYPEAVGYLIQEGLTKDSNYALVDSGWVGTLQCSIEKLVKSVRPEINVEGYYFGMYEIPKGADATKFHPFFFGKKFGLKRKVLFSNSLFEAVVSSKEGMTIGYGHNSKGYYPLENEVKNPNSEMISSNIAAMTCLLNHIRDFNRWETIKKAELTRLFTLLMSSLTDIEIEAYGELLFSDDVIDGCFKKVAAELTYDQIKDQRIMRKLLILLGIRKRTIYESSWIEGSAVKCGVNVKRCLRHIRFYKFLVFARKQFNG